MNNLPKIIEKSVLELGLAFACVTIGVEIHSCQRINECQESLAVIEPSLNNSASAVFCESPLLKDNYLRLIDERINPKVAYNQVLKEYCKRVKCPAR